MALFVLSSARSFAVTLEELKNDAALTPVKFASHFRGFKFHFRGEVQDAATFLKKRSGDCDDYAILGAQLLQARGYTPRLIAVRTKRVVHVVCYIEEERGFLDYERRSSLAPIEKCDPSLEAVANAVSASFKSEWTSVSEFTYADGWKKLVRTARPPGWQNPAGAVVAKADEAPKGVQGDLASLR